MKHELNHSDTEDNTEQGGGSYRKSPPPRFRAPILPPTIRPDLHPGAPVEVPPPQREGWLPLNKAPLLHEAVIKHPEDDDEEEEDRTDDAPRRQQSSSITVPPEEVQKAELQPDAAEDEEAEDEDEARAADGQSGQPVQPTPMKSEFAATIPIQAEQDDDHVVYLNNATAQATVPSPAPVQAQHIPRPPISPVAERQAFTSPIGEVPALHVPERPSIWQPEAASPFSGATTEYDPDDDDVSVSSAHGGGQKPPTVPPTSKKYHGVPEDGELHPAYYGYNVASTAQQAASSEQYAPTVEARDSRVNKVAILLGAEYFLRRRMGRQIRQEMHDLANRQHQDVLKSTAKAQEQQATFAREQQRYAQEVRTVHDRQEQMAAMPLTYGAEQAARRPSVPFEVPGQAVRQERPPLAPIVVPERAKQQAGERVEAEQAQQQYDVQPRQHVEQDAWRRYVVDEHGREVQDAITYGEAFHQERQQEIRRDLVSDDTAGLAAGSVGGVIMHGQQVQHPTLPSGLTGTALPQGRPTHADPQHQLPASASNDDSFGSNLTNPWFWVMLILIVAAFFTAALI